MNNEIIINKIKERYTSQLLTVDLSSDMLSIVIESSVIYDVIKMLKDELGFSFLTSLCGIHYPEQELQLGVIYHLHNLQENKRIRLKAFISIDKPEIKSIVDIFSGANWMCNESSF